MLLSAFEDHLLSPRGRARLSDGPHTGASGGAACGDLVRITVALKADRIVDAGFDASGCGAAQAAASAAVELVSGAPLLEAARFGADEVAA
ncbi:MAG: iron-sulfur cluster assembly scaffold protein, partial [Actinomycetota bacterium]|nr:iron-sulfur cluster assembly scaffold protein [Actinomycetota bacterium]